FLNAAIGVLTRMVISCHLAMESGDPSKDRSVQVMGLPVMEVLLVDLLARHDGITLPDIDPLPDPHYRQAIEDLITEDVAADPGRKRRFAYLAEQLAISRREPIPSDGMDPITPDSMPNLDHLIALHHIARGRLA